MTSQRGSHRQRCFHRDQSGPRVIAPRRPAPNGPTGPAIDSPHRTRRSRPVVSYWGAAGMPRSPPALGSRTARSFSASHERRVSVSLPTVLCNRDQPSRGSRDPMMACTPRSDRTREHDAQRHSPALASRGVATANRTVCGGKRRPGVHGIREALSGRSVNCGRRASDLYAHQQVEMLGLTPPG